MTLVEFLTAQLDKAEAREHGKWRYKDALLIQCPVEACESRAHTDAFDGDRWSATFNPCGHTLTGEDVRTHLGEPCPDRAVLADIASKREIIKTCDYFLNDSEDGPDPASALVLRHLATAYAEHSDYRSEWAP